MITDLDQLLRSLDPHLNPGAYVFASLPEGQPFEPSTAVAFIREAEGASVVMDAAAAAAAGLPITQTYAWISLSVHSDLQAVGLTAALARALAAAKIACNVVAGTRHDHVFVPTDQAQAALSALLALQRQHVRD
jgi:uncharacterized protein